MPSPFALAVLLTGFTLGLAWFFGDRGLGLGDLLLHWQQGFFGFLGFSMQMALILLLGQVLARGSWFRVVLSYLAHLPRTTAGAAALTCLISCALALFNWGLGLIFGALLARDIAQRAAARGLNFNYPLLGASAYVGMMVWHSGLSGSAPLAVAEAGHRLEAFCGQIPLSKTVLARPNLMTLGLLLLILPCFAYVLGLCFPRHQGAEVPPIPLDQPLPSAKGFDASPLMAYGLGFLMLAVAVLPLLPLVSQRDFDWTFSFLQPNFLIFILFALALLSLGSFQGFVLEAERGMASLTGILLQFPFYAGIMALMTESGLLAVWAQGFTSWSSAEYLPILNFFSAGLINIFVPSGGGQWLVQGPIVLTAAKDLGASMETNLMALCYGDQWTNMVQPFWALPLLGITKLAPRLIAPYALAFMLPGLLIFIMALVFFY